MAISNDVALVILLFVLIVVPRALQRYRIPGAVTALVLGFVGHNLGWVESNAFLRLFSTFGIVALFLFAGLEINGGELRRNSRLLIEHGIAWALLLGLVAVGAYYTIGMSGRGSTLFALAILTPSTGFILSTLPSSGLAPDEQFAVKTKAIALELLSLGALFVVTQSVSWQQFGLALTAMLAVVLIIPLAFRFFASALLPYAPRSEFAFLLVVAVISAMITRELGVYYLLGAFVTGVAAQRFRSKLPALSSEKMVDALEAFGSVFIPFYFFGAGMHIETAQASWWALAFGLALLMAFVPLRIAFTVAHRRISLTELRAHSRRVATALVPTLVFTLVLSELLRDQYQAPDFVVGALVVYAVINTTLPSYLLGAPTPTFESVEASPTPPEDVDAAPA